MANAIEPQNFWVGKKAKIFINKDNHELIFTAIVLEIDNSHITFKDREGLIYSFNRELVREMKVMQ